MVYTSSIDGVTLTFDCEKLGARIAKNKREAQIAFNRQIQKDTEQFVPKGRTTATLRQSVCFPDGIDGKVIAWNTPYAHYMYVGIVYQMPPYKLAGFHSVNKNGEGYWWSIKGMKKEPRLQDIGARQSIIQYHYGGGSNWFQKSREKNLSKWIDVVGKELTK